MGCCIAQPKVDGRRYTDSRLNEYTLLYEDDVYMYNLVDILGDMIEAVVLVDSEGDTITYPKSLFVEEFVLIDDETLDLFEENQHA